MNDDPSQPRQADAFAETITPQDTDGAGDGGPFPRQLGRYRLIRVVGRGAMGIVFEAVDTHLNRTVAVKTLPDGFAGDDNAVTRFNREASLLASLNHPNIATVYSHEDLNGQHCLVMEFVEGQALDEFLEISPTNMKESLQLARQIASALEAAHDHGVIHRDLKPANIRVTSSFTAKVLDFGLAKQIRLVDPGSGSSVTDAVQTASGQILGTPAYMSPEQARGRSLDKRTDMWSFGCVFFEILTGSRAFHAETVTDTLVSIVERDPDWTQLPDSTPAGIRRLIERCLQKDRETRLPDAGAARLDIEEALAVTSSAGPDPVADTIFESTLHAPRVARSRRVIPTLILCLVVGLVSGLTTALLRTDTVAPPVTQEHTAVIRSTYHFAREPIEKLHTVDHIAVRTNALAISPDGTRIAFVANLRDRTQIFVRDLSRFQADPIPGTEAGYMPFLSPDGTRLGFFTQNELKFVAIQRGTPTTLCGARNVAGACWSDDGTIYFCEHHGTRISSIKANGGSKNVVFEGGTLLLWPHILPGGKGLLLTSLLNSELPSSSLDYARIMHFSLETRDLRILHEGGYFAMYARTGHLLFMRGDSLMAVNFDINDLRIGHETAVPVVPEVLSQQVAVSANGHLVYVSGKQNLATVPVWVDRAGNVEPLPMPPADYGPFQLSPDNQRLAIQVNGIADHVYVYDVDHGTGEQLTATGVSRSPFWSTDNRLVFQWLQANHASLAWKDVATSAAPTVLAISGPSLVPECLSPDGKKLVYTNWSAHSNIAAFSLTDPPETEDLIASDFNEWGGKISPDGKWLAYVSDRDGQYNIYVRSYPLTDTRVWKISPILGEEPIWSPAGGELFFRNGAQFMAVQYSSETEFQHAPPELVFTGPYANIYGISFDVAKDGQRLLVLKPVFDDAALTELRIVHHWGDELTRLVPTGEAP